MTKKLTEASIKKEQMKNIRSWLKEAEDVVLIKKKLLEGEMEELGEDVKNPKDELAQLMKLVKEAEEKGLGEIGKLLLAVEVDTRLLKESVGKEITLIEELTKDAKGTDEREILNEIREELELAQHIQHQINVLQDIHRLCSEIETTILCLIMQ